MTKKIHLLIDMDNTITNLDYQLQKIYEIVTGVKLHLRNKDNWWNSFKLHNIGNKIINIPYLFETLPQIPGAISSLKKLQEKGHKITIVTSPPNELGSEDIFKAKIKWLYTNTPFLGSNPLDYTVYTTQKQLVIGDLLIDDMASHIAKFEATGRPGCLVQYPDNQDAKATFYMKHWKDVFEIVEKLGFNYLLTLGGKESS